MKKTLLLAGCFAMLLACNSREESATTTDENGKYYESPETDSAGAAAVSAAARQSEVDTNVMNIGTSRTAGVATASVEQGEKLIAQSDCLTCHKVDQKIVGPSYQEVARKYENNDKNIEYLAGKIIEGGSGVWGQVPMTPHPNISREDAREMARYILSLRK